MSVQLLVDIFVGGVKQTAGSTISIDNATEAELVQNRKAVWVVAPSQSNGVPVTATTDPVTGGISLSAGGASGMWIGSHVSAAIIGDSISRRHISQGVITNQTAMGMWNWANWMLGAPFVFTHNLGVSGDVTRSIMSRISAVKQNTQVVCLMTGTNDVLSMSSSANQATIDSTYTNVSGYIQQGVSALVAAGKKVILSTIIPNNAISTGSDSRIQLLDRLNAFIATLASPSVFVVDSFSALWDAAQPTLRVCKANTMNSDGTHPAAAGSYLIGKAALTAFRSAYAASIPDVDIYDDFHLCRPLYAAFRSGTNGEAPIKTNGTGNLADGWRSINNAGTATFTLENANAYAVSSNYIGPFRDAPADVDSHWQEFNVTSAVANDVVRFQTPGSSTITNLTAFPDCILGGDLFFAEIDIEVSNPVSLTQVFLSLHNYFTVGTSPVDQAYQGTTYNAVGSGSSGDFSSTEHALPEGWRGVLRTPVLRSPENINVTVAQNLQMFVDMKFNGAGSALVKLGRPRIWHKVSGYI